MTIIIITILIIITTNNNISADYNYLYNVSRATGWAGI